MSELGLGEFLRQERERRGLSLEQVATATKIGMRYLISIEADQYSDLPAKPFVRGFVVSYCRFIGADAETVCRQYDEFLDARFSALPKRETHFEGYAFERKATERSRTLLVAFMLGFIALGAIAIVVLKPSLRHKRSGHLEALKVPKEKKGEQVLVFETVPDDFVGPPRVLRSETSEATATSAAPTTGTLATPATAAAPPTASPAVAPVASPIPSLTPAPTPTSVVATPTAAATPNADPLAKGDDLKKGEFKQKVVFKAKNDVWIRYRIDDRQAMRFLLKKGNLLVVKARERVRFQVADTDAIEFRANDSGPYLPFLNAQQIVTQGENPIAFFPPEAPENIKEIFPGTQPLKKLTPAPAPSN